MKRLTPFQCPIYAACSATYDPDVRLMELDGYGHAPREPFYPLLLNEIKRVLKAQQ